MTDTIHVECGPGWAELYEPVVAMARAKGIPVLQVKQKWGRLRIYVGGVDPELDAAITAAEVASATTCETCGAPGTRRTLGGGYWVETTCDVHAHAGTITDALNVRHRCPACDGRDFQIGPMGGLAANIRCIKCGRKYWYCPPFTPYEIDHEDELYARAAIVDLAAWRRTP